MTIVDIGYGTIHRVPLQQGSWFAADDGQRLAPAVVVSESFYNQAGRPNLTTHPTVSIPGDRPATAVIIGVVPDTYPDTPPSAFILSEGAAMTGMEPQTSQFKMWVGEEQSDALKAAISADLQGQFPGYYAQADRMDYAAWGDPLASVQLVVGGVAGLVLLLGAVGMLNISMVTVRYRVHGDRHPPQLRSNVGPDLCWRDDGIRGGHRSRRRGRCHAGGRGGQAPVD